MSKIEYVPEGFSIISVEDEERDAELREEDRWVDTVGDTPADDEFIFYFVEGDRELAREFELRTGVKILYTEVVSEQRPHLSQGWADNPTQTASGHDWFTRVDDSGRVHYSRTRGRHQVRSLTDGEAEEINYQRWGHSEELKNREWPLFREIIEMGLDIDDAVKAYRSWSTPSSGWVVTPRLVQIGGEYERLEKLIEMFHRDILTALSEDIDESQVSDFDPPMTSPSDRYVGNLWNHVPVNLDGHNICGICHIAKSTNGSCFC